MSSYKLVQVPLVSGLQEKVDPRIAPSGALDSAENVVHDKRGTFSKRRGFRLLDHSNTLDLVGANPGESKQHALSGLDGTLISFGYDRVWAVISRDKTADDGSHSSVFRTHASRGLVWLQRVTGSAGGGPPGGV